MAFKIPKPTYDPDLVAAVEEHLCQEYWTEIYQTAGPDDNGLLTHYTNGADTKTYSRPMFQLYKDGASSSFPVNYTPCPDCDDFAYTSNCETHYELGWDSKRHDFNIRQLQPEPTVVQSPSQAPDGLYNRIVELYGRQLNLSDFVHADRYAEGSPLDAYRRMLTDEERIQDRVARLPDATLRIDGVFNEGTVEWEYDSDEPF